MKYVNFSYSQISGRHVRQVRNAQEQPLKGIF